jgi:2-desacetyl-2-hydroxyethyl bacteriochlorophyllide A dehydrogenase
MRAVAVTQPGEVRLVELDKPDPGPYQALVRTEAASLCNSTDSKLVAGHFPGVDRYPLVLGHESAGIVEAVGARVRNFEIGQRAIGGLVFDFGQAGYSSGWGGFSDFTLVNDHDAMVADGVADAAHGWFEVYEIQRAVASDIPLEAAVLLCTWREVYGGFGDFHLQAGDDVVIFGAGPVGASFVKLGRLLGLNYIGVVDPVESKRARALAMGADQAFAPDSPELAELPRRRAKPLDAVIDAVGSERIVNAGLSLIGMGGSICVYGVIAEPAIAVHKHLGPYNFNLYVHQWPTRRRERAAMEPLCDWIRGGQLRAADFITHEFPVEKIGEALAAVATGQSLKVLLRY